jgi:Mrp family chromosome partitioning ATPase
MLLNSDTFAAVIEEACRHFDRVILDIPPLLIVADGLIAMRRAHGVLVVFKYNLVHQGAARKIREKIEASGCPLLGAVMNQVRYEKTRPYEGYYYRHYRDYYRHRHRPLKDETEKPGRGRFSTGA